MSLLRSLSAECWLTGNQIISLLIKMNALRIHFNLSPPQNRTEQNRLFYHTQVPCFVGDLQSEGLKTRSRLPGPGDTWLLYFQRLQIQQDSSEVCYCYSTAELTLYHEDSRLRGYMSHISVAAQTTEYWGALSPEMTPSAGKWQSSEHGLTHSCFSYFFGMSWADRMIWDRPSVLENTPGCI